MGHDKTEPDDVHKFGKHNNNTRSVILWKNERIVLFKNEA